MSRGVSGNSLAAAFAATAFVAAVATPLAANVRVQDDVMHVFKTTMRMGAATPTRARAPLAARAVAFGTAMVVSTSEQAPAAVRVAATDLSFGAAGYDDVSLAPAAPAHPVVTAGKTSYWDERYTKDPEPFDW